MPEWSAVALVSGRALVRLIVAVSALAPIQPAVSHECKIPKFVTLDHTYDFQTATESVVGTVKQIDQHACWLLTTQHGWINLSPILRITDKTKHKPNYPQVHPLVGKWSCTFSSTGKHLANFQYGAKGQLSITGDGSVKEGTWLISVDNVLSWKYNSGGGEDLDHWEVTNGILRITEGNDKLVCRPI